MYAVAHKVSAVVGVALAAWGAPVRAAGPCTDADGAALDGDPRLVSAIGGELARRGVATDAACPAMHVHLVAEARGIRARIEVDGRAFERSAGDAETMATIIEMWARPEEEGSLFARAAPRRLTLPSDEPGVSLAVPAPNRRQHFGVGLIGETAYGSDGSLWLGAAASACVMFGPLCVGARARVATDTTEAGGSEDVSMLRLGTDVLLDAELPVTRRGVVISPGLGVGTGWLHAEGVVTAGTMEPMDVDTGGLRGEARLAVSVPIGHGARIDVELAVDVAPLSHTRTWHDPTGRALPGEPNAFGRVGVGLRFGGP